VSFIIPLNPSGEIAKYRAHIDKLSHIDSPEIFGLHPSADITFRLKESLAMINTIIETRPKEGGIVGGKSREE